MSIYSGIHAIAKAVLPSPLWTFMVECKGVGVWPTLEKAVLPSALRNRMLDDKARGLRQAEAAKHASAFYTMYYKGEIDRIFTQIFETGETNNFTYDLNGHNMEYLAHAVSSAVGRPFDEINGYIQEVVNDSALKQAAGFPSHFRSGFGRRLGWYAVARATKPKIVVETGVERGHGALILCAALLRNLAEGYPGRYFGTDINPSAGKLLRGQYAQMGGVLYGDSITTLQGLNETIDLFVNDSDHSADYEYEEYLTIRDKLSPTAIVLGDNSHASIKLARFSQETGRQFLFFREQPQNHWYPGAGIGISFPPRAP